MKNLTIIFISLFWTTTILAQQVKLESSIIVDTIESRIATQRVEVSSKFINIKYDYDNVGSDVLSLIKPDLFSDSLYDFGLAYIKIGDRHAIDFLGRYQFAKLKTSFELGRIFNPGSSINDVLGFKLSYSVFTAEAYIVSDHSLSEGIAENDKFYAWLAYHPNNFYISAGISDKQYWFLAGTKKLERFGNFSLFNYNPENGNFWILNQSGFGQINQNFFNQELYILSTHYLVVPAFHFIHFSPIATKGTYSFKLDGRRTNGVYTGELAMGKEIGKNFLRASVGIKSKYDTDLNFAPTLELYKDLKLSSSSMIIELRYDFIFKVLNLYLIIKY